MPNLNSPILTGDVSGGLHSTSVDKLKGQAVASTTPTSGQVLTWNGTAWAPATASTGGGGGANGLTYYLNQGTNADAPTTNLPGTPKQLGRSADTTQTTATTGTLTSGVWTQFAGFVSESLPQDPAVTEIPAGLWDFNVWAYGVSNSSEPNSIRAKVFKYDGSNAPTLLATSASQNINSTSALYSLTVLVPETTLLATDRIFVTLEALSTGNNHSVTAQFGDGTPSHVHTTLPLVGGTGLWKSVAGAVQSPASLLVDADVDASAAIAQSKISGLTTDLAAKAAQVDVQYFTTVGTSTWTKPAGARAIFVQVISGGGGGGGGGKSASGTAVSGGGGGGGSGCVDVLLRPSDLPSTVTVTVGVGGTAGTAASVTGAGGNGGPGGYSSFGSYVRAERGSGGTGGNAGTNPSGGGGGQFGGNNGGAGSSTGLGTGAGYTNRGGAGGGPGGGVNASSAALAGIAGGFGMTTLVTGGTAGAGGAAGVNGGAGGTTGATSLFNGSGGGGGGGGTGTTGGNGGNGGGYGTGGGGGGATIGSGNSGAGGAGAQGLVIVTTYF